MRDRLAPTGCWSLNAGHPEGQDGFEKVLSATIGEVFPLRDARPDQADQHADRREPRAARAPPAALGAACRRALRVGRAGRSSRLEPPLRGGDVYTDDKAPVEWLIDKSIVDYAARARH